MRHSEKALKQHSVSAEILVPTIKPHHEKINVFACKNKDTDQFLCFRYIASTIPLLSKSEISSL